MKKKDAHYSHYRLAKYAKCPLCFKEEVLKKELRIEADLKRRLHAEGGKSLDRIVSLRDKASSPSDITRLKAAQDILDRLGIKPEERIGIDGTMHFVIEHVKRDEDQD